MLYATRPDNNVVVNFVKASARHPKVVTSFAVYLVGIYALFFVTGYAVTPGVLFIAVNKVCVLSYVSPDVDTHYFRAFEAFT